MNPKDARRIERMLRQLERRTKRAAGGFSLAPIYLALGLVLGDRLLVWLVPMVWNATLPGGFEQALKLPGISGLLAHLALVASLRSASAWMILAGIVVLGFVVSRFFRPLRFLLWLAVVGVVLLDAGILFVTLKTALAVTTAEAGLG